MLSSTVCFFFFLFFHFLFLFFSFLSKQLLVGLVSSYRYEGPRVNVETAQIESQTLHTAIKNAHKKKPKEDEDVVRILATRSKAHLKTIFNIYKETYGHNIHDVSYPKF